ncbi:MAG: hypothetical protein H6Q68_589 [Firmicutes bacterium]|nr:hypothetical protein [Bacillota bacterium]
MNVNLQQEMVLVTVIGVEGLPCSVRGQKNFYAIGGEKISGNFQLPWKIPSTWLEEQVADLVRENLTSGLFGVAKVSNPEEPDQIITVMLELSLPPHEVSNSFYSDLVKNTNKKRPLVIVKGGGDLATGVAYRLFKCGLKVILTELSRPLTVRRTVSFSEAVYENTVHIEGIQASMTSTIEQALQLLDNNILPVLIDPNAEVIEILRPMVVVDAIMAKRNQGTTLKDAPLVIGLGPGFTAGLDVHVVIETCRGHTLGRAIYCGNAIANTAAPGAIDGHTWKRLLKSPVDGKVLQSRPIGSQVEQGDIVALVDKIPVYAEIAGVIRGMIKENVWISKGTKIGDIDPRRDAEWDTISDKALAIGGGVLEAVFHFLAFPKEKCSYEKDGDSMV